MVDSISKTQLDRTTIEAIVRRAFGDDAALDRFEPCDEGWFNAVYRLVLADGTRCVLKVAPPPDVRVLRYEHDIITSEVDALRLAAERTDVPVPAVLAWDDSCTLVASPWFLMEECPGVLLGPLRAELDAAGHAFIDTQVVRLVSALNRITGTSFGRPDRAAVHDATWPAAFGRLVSDLLADGVDAGVELPIPYEEIADLVADRLPLLADVAEPQFVHWDLWDLNVFVDPDSLEVVGVIDFERVLWGDPLMEAQFIGKRGSDPIVEAYGEALFDAPHAVARRQLYDLYLYLVMTIECAYRGYPTDDIEQFARACLEATVAELRAD